MAKETKPVENSSVYAVLMAGGVGSRFWPLSRARTPKQLLALGSGSESLIQSTARRIRPVVDQENIWVVTSQAQQEAVSQQLSDVPSDQILPEPVGRNTAACVGWAAISVRRKDPQGILAVLPADHYIGNEDAYATVLANAAMVAADGYLVTVGIKPTRPETGYGYIELGKSLGKGAYAVERFIEKPDRARAAQLLAGGRYLWNSGLFFFRVDVILSAIEKHMPELYAQLLQYDEAAARGEEMALVAKTYATLPSVSVDTGIMEKSDNLAVLMGDFSWSDLGSWQTAWELAPKDTDGNAGENILSVESRNCYVRGNGKKVVALVGLDDVVVVDTEDALLIMPRERSQDVKRIVEELKKRGVQRLL